METTKRLVTYDQARFIRDPGWIRTNDTRFRRAVLYPLSYGANCGSLSHPVAVRAAPVWCGPPPAVISWASGRPCGRSAAR